MKANRSKKRLAMQLAKIAQWLLLFPLIMVVMLICGQLALTSVSEPPPLQSWSNLAADYNTWEYTFIKAVDPAIIEAIRRDGQSDSALLPVDLPAQGGWPGLPGSEAAPATRTAPPDPIPSALPATATRLPASPTPQPSTTLVWIYASPTTTPPPPEPTPLKPTPTSSPTASPTATETASPTPVNTAAPPPPGLNIGSPDSIYAEISNGSSVIIDLTVETGAPLDTSTADADFDLIVYERFYTPGHIQLDHTILEVSPGPSGACAASAGWMPVFIWGDNDTSNNGHLGASFGLPELDNTDIAAADLIGPPGLETGIGIDVDALGLSGVYPCLRIQSPISGDGDPSEIDAIEILP